MYIVLCLNEIIINITRINTAAIFHFQIRRRGLGLTLYRSFILD